MRRIALPCSKRLWRTSASASGRHSGFLLLEPASQRCLSCRRSARLLHSLTLQTRSTLVRQGGQAPATHHGRSIARCFSSAEENLTSSEAGSGSDVAAERETQEAAGDSQVAQEAAINANEADVEEVTEIDEDDPTIPLGGTNSGTGAIATDADGESSAILEEGEETEGLEDDLDQAMSLEDLMSSEDEALEESGSIVVDEEVAEEIDLGEQDPFLEVTSESSDRTFASKDIETLEMFQSSEESMDLSSYVDYDPEYASWRITEEEVLNDAEEAAKYKEYSELPPLLELPFTRQTPNALDGIDKELLPQTFYSARDLPMHTFRINGDSLQTFVRQKSRDNTPPNRFKDMLLTPGLGFFDRTQYLVQMSRGGYDMEMLYFRPEGFGKSLFVDMVHFFHGKEYRDMHKWIFKGLDVHEKLATGEGRNLVPGRFTVLHLDFSALKKHALFKKILSDGEWGKKGEEKRDAELFVSFSKEVNRTMREAVRHYFRVYPDEERQYKDVGSRTLLRQPDPIRMIKEYVIMNIERKKHNLYIILEDFDWVVYAHQLYVKYGDERAYHGLWGNKEVQDAIHGVGKLRRLWLAITQGMEEKRPSIRYLCVGTAPWKCIDLPPLSIASRANFNRTMNTQMGSLAGLRLEELNLAIATVLKAKEPDITPEKLAARIAKHVEWMEKLYGGYVMSDVGGIATTFNTSLCVRYLQRLLASISGKSPEATMLQSVQDLQNSWKNAISSVQGRPLPYRPVNNELLEVAQAVGNPMEKPMPNPFILDKIKCLPPQLMMQHEDFKPMVDFFYFWENPDIKSRQEDDCFLHYHGLLSLDPNDKGKLRIPNITALRGIERNFVELEKSRALVRLAAKSEMKAGEISLKQTTAAATLPNTGSSSSSIWEQASSRDGFRDLVWDFLRSFRWRRLTNLSPIMLREKFWEFLMWRHRDDLYERNWFVADMEAAEVHMPFGTSHLILIDHIPSGLPRAHVLHFSYFDDKVDTDGERRWTLFTHMEKIQQEIVDLSTKVNKQLRAYCHPQIVVWMHPIVLMDHRRNKRVPEAERQEARKAREAWEDKTRTLAKARETEATEAIRPTEGADTKNPATTPATGDEVAQKPIEEEEQGVEEEDLEESDGPPEELKGELDATILGHQAMIAWTKPFHYEAKAKKAKKNHLMKDGLTKHHMLVQFERYAKAAEEADSKDPEVISNKAKTMKKKNKAAQLKEQKNKEKSEIRERKAKTKAEPDPIFMSIGDRPRGPNLRRTATEEKRAIAANMFQGRDRGKAERGLPQDNLQLKKRFAKDFAKASNNTGEETRRPPRTKGFNAALPNPSLDNTLRQERLGNDWKRPSSRAQFNNDASRTNPMRDSYPPSERRGREQDRTDAPRSNDRGQQWQAKPQRSYNDGQARPKRSNEGSLQSSERQARGPQQERNQSNPRRSRS